MFIVGDGDGSDVENDNEDRGLTQAPGAETYDHGGTKHDILTEEPEQQVNESKQAMEDRKQTRRYHALLELITTEVGYLTDLRALVSVCLSRTPERLIFLSLSS